jgi:hypothetical protein
MFNPIEHLNAEELAWYKSLNAEDRQLTDKLIWLGTLNRKQVKKLSKIAGKLITERGLNV